MFAADYGMWLNGSMTFDNGICEVTADGTMRLDTENNFQGSLTASLNAPWWLGGWSLASANAYVQYYSDTDTTNDYFLAGGKILGIKRAVRYDFNTGEFDWTAGYGLIEQVTIDPPPAAKEGSSKAKDATEHPFTVPAEVDATMFDVTWDTADTDLILTDPSGTPYTTANVESYSNVSYYKNPDGGEAIFEVISPDAGQWTVALTAPEAVGGYTIDHGIITEQPTISVTSPAVDTADSTVSLTWTDDDTDSDATVRLCYDTDRAGADGVLIADGISEDDETDAYTWDTTGVPTGDYYVYVVVDDGVNLPAIRYSTGRVSVVDPDAPEPVTGLSAVEPGDDWVRLSWDASTAADLDHYLIRYTSDARGEFYESTVSPGAETSYVLGTHEDEDISPGTTYRATVAAVDADGHVSVDAEPVVFTIGAATADVFAVPGQVVQWQVPGEPGADFSDQGLPQGAAMDANGLITWGRSDRCSRLV